MSDERRILENLAPPTPDGNGAPVEKNDQPGCVKRVLNFRDRNQIMVACRAWFQRNEKSDKNDEKAILRMNKVQKLLAFEETMEYFEMIEDSYAFRQAQWQRERQAWIAGQGPNPGKKPQPTPEEQRGQERVFHIPSKQDAWIEEAIRGMKWHPIGVEYVAELFERFQIGGE